MEVRSYTLLPGLGIALILAAAPAGLRAQGSPIPVKPGLWEIVISSQRTMQLPPDMEAKIAAMPEAQQAQMRSMMGSSNKPIEVTRQVCFSAQSTMDNLLDQAQQPSGGLQCNFTNRVETARGASYDETCKSANATAQSHTDFHVIDDEHISTKSHTTVTGTMQGHPSNSTVDATSTGKFVKADCGDVKPVGIPAAPAK
jgi:hypothetical protein